MTLAQACAWGASIISITSVYFYGNKQVKAGALLGLCSQVPWTTIAVISHLWGMALATVFFTSMHVRTLVKWRSH